MMMNKICKGIARDRQTDTDRHRDTDSKRDRQKDTDRQTQTDTNTNTITDTDRQRLTDTHTQIHTHTENPVLVRQVFSHTQPPTVPSSRCPNDAR